MTMQEPTSSNTESPATSNTNTVEITKTDDVAASCTGDIQKTADQQVEHQQFEHQQFEHQQVKDQQMTNESTEDQQDEDQPMAYESTEDQQVEDQLIDESTKIEMNESSENEMDIDNTEPDHFRKIFVGGLHYRSTNETICIYFSQFGKVVDSIVMHDQNGRSRGFGFVTFAVKEIVDKVMSNRPHTIDAREIDVKRATPKELRPDEYDSFGFKTNLTSQPKNPIKKIFIGALREGICEKDLRTYFETFGKVVDCKILRDGENKTRGFGFLEFDDYDPVDKVVLHGNHIINNQKLDIKKAIPRPNPSDVTTNMLPIPYGVSPQYMYQNPFLGFPMTPLTQFHQAFHGSPYSRTPHHLRRSTPQQLRRSTPQQLRTPVRPMMRFQRGSIPRAPGAMTQSRMTRAQPRTTRLQQTRPQHSRPAMISRTWKSQDKQYIPYSGKPSASIRNPNAIPSGQLPYGANNDYYQSFSNQTYNPSVQSPHSVLRYPKAFLNTSQRQERIQRMPSADGISRFNSPSGFSGKKIANFSRMRFPREQGYSANGAPENYSSNGVVAPERAAVYNNMYRGISNHRINTPRASNGPNQYSKSFGTYATTPTRTR